MPIHTSTKPAARNANRGFTLVELLVVVSIIALLISILLPTLRRARQQGRSTVCLSQIRTLGQGIAMYAMDNNDDLLPGRMPNMGDGINWRGMIAGGLKYRPTFLATMGAYVGVPAFDKPMPEKNVVDDEGESGDRQNYSNRTYVCPSVSNWTDERNGSYGYNYQFLGNSRLLDDSNPTSYKNWPVKLTAIRSPGNCVAVADCMGTAASYAHRKEYINNARDADRYGNEGFNLDPPRVDALNGEMANLDKSPQSRTALHARHSGKGSVLWLDAHGSSETLKGLGYVKEPSGVVAFNGNNRFFHTGGKDQAWLQPT